MDKGPLGVHQIKLVVKPGPGLGDGGGVGEHADTSGNLGEVTPGHNSWWLVVDADLETSGTPVNKLDGPLGLDGGNSRIDVLGDNISPVEHAAGHVLAVAGVAFHHLVGWLKTGVGDLGHGELLVVRLLRGDDRGVHSQGEMDPERRKMMLEVLIKKLI